MHWIAVAVFLILLPMVVGGVRISAARWGWSAEGRRKAVHMAMGLAVLPFPWLFDSLWPVVAICVLSLGVVSWIRHRESHPDFRGVAVLHGVGRASLGDVLFPLAVVVVFWFSLRHVGGDGDRVFFLVPILILTLADAAGALVGTKYGVKTFTSLSGWKSVEGCLTFFLSAFLAAHIPILLMTDTGRAESLLIACILALVVMMFEAISTRGLDNLIVPLAATILLDRFLDLDTAALVWRLLGAAGLFALVFGLRRGSSLDGGALLGAVLFGYGCWSLGGWRFVVPPVILFAEHLWVTRRLRRVAKLHHDLLPVLAVGVALLPWPLLAAWRPDWVVAALAAFVCGTAAHLAMFNLATRVFVATRPATMRMKNLASLKAVMFVGIGGLLLATPDPGFVILGCFAVLLILRVVVEIFARLARVPEDGDNHPGRWIRQGMLSCFAGLLMFGVVRIF